MVLPRILSNLSLPVVGSPMFIVSNPALVIAQSIHGVVGSLPALNARPQESLSTWLGTISAALADHDATCPDRPAAPYAVNHIVHRSNTRLGSDLDTTVEHHVPIVITSLGVREDVNNAVHSYGGIVLHDVTTNEFAKKAIDRGADGLIAVAAGAGGHAGHMSPFALVREIRLWYDGPVVLAGAISHGSSVLAAQAAGADLAYVGSAFITATESDAPPAYKQMVIDSVAADIVNSNVFTGVHGNYLRRSIEAAGLNPDDLPDSAETVDFGAKAWRDIWGAGHGVGGSRRVESAASTIARLAREYEAARAALGVQTAR